MSFAPKFIAWRYNTYSMEVKIQIFIFLGGALRISDILFAFNTKVGKVPKR